MLDEVVSLMADVPAGLVVDATLGGGGHTEAILDARPDLTVLGLDQDPDALAAASRRLARFGDRAILRHARFDRLAHVMAEIAPDLLPSAAAAASAGADPSLLALAGALFDLGVSSPQLDRAERGFSVHQEGPLDMRMDTTGGTTAADVVNTYPEHELARILSDNGDERFARRIAGAIVAARPITTTAHLSEVVKVAIPAAARRKGGHPARRTFQALRIEVNQELDVLVDALDQALDLLTPGGRCVVLAYHSGEDRIVKQRFRRAADGGCTCPPQLPCVCGAEPEARLLSRGARRASTAEVERNRRAESVRLRAVEKLVVAS